MREGFDVNLWSEKAFQKMKEWVGDRLLVANCMVVYDPDTMGIDVLPMIVGDDKHSPMPENERRAIKQTFDEFEKVIQKLFHLTDYNPAEAWKALGGTKGTAG